MNFQEEIERLEGLFRNPKGNESEIMRIYYTITKTGGSDASNVFPILNQKAVHLLSPEVVDILNKSRLNAYGYLLVAHNMLDLEDIKDDLLNGEVLANAIPPNTIRKLKTQLGLSSATTTPSAIPHQLNPMDNIKAQSTSQPRQHEETVTSDENDREHGEISSRLPIQIRNLCTNTETIEGMTLLKLPLKIESTFEGASSIVKRFSFGEPDTWTGRKSKTILLIGETGSGKTTMINAMINYVLGVEWDDPFRFVLIDEQVTGESQAHSQTLGVTAYDIHYTRGFRVPFSLTIVDTPGFGDTGGIERDKEIKSAVQAFFENSNGIQELDAVGFVVQSALVRLTSSQKYIFNSVLEIFGKDIETNILFLTTFADGNSPLVLEAIKVAKLPCLMDRDESPYHQSFNNGAIYKSPQSANSKRFRMDWEDGMENFKSFFDHLADMPTKSLQMTSEVLEMRKYFEIQLDFMHRDISKQLMKMEELRKTEEQIALNRDKVNANKNFEVQVPVSKKVKLQVDGKSALNCTKCEVTCHHPCNPILWSGFCPAFFRFEDIVLGSKCAMKVLETVIKIDNVPAEENLKNLSAVADTVMKTVSNLVSPNRTCNVCPGNCPVGDHTNENGKWDLKQELETKTMNDIQKAYQDAMGKKLNAEELLKSLELEVEQLTTNILKTMEAITCCSNQLKEKALKDNPITTLEYIQMIIDEERANEKPGYEERIKSLEDVLERAKLTQDIVGSG